MKKLKVYVSENGLNKLNQYLEDYKNEVRTKTKMFLEILADQGIASAKASFFPLNDIGDVSNLIEFRMDLEEATNGYKAVVLAFDIGKIISEWQTKTGGESVEVSPLLMAEFGSGWMADNPLNVSGVGQGTFQPNKGHAHDAKGWWWVDMNGVKHHSIGITPTQPMYHAQQRMLQIMDMVAKEVFK